MEERCVRWVNFSAFSARSTATGLQDIYNDPHTFGVREIAECTKENFKPGPRRDCQIFAAAQYILISGDKMYSDIAKQSKGTSKEQSWFKKEWPIRTKKFGAFAIECRGAGQTEMAAVLSQTHEKMVALAA